MLRQGGKLGRLAMAGACLAGACSSLQGQNGKEFIGWLKEFSPTGYFIINDYETKVKNPGFHKAYIQNKKAPIPVVPVHETGHMWNWEYGGGINSGGKASGYYIGNLKGYKVDHNFKAFNSKELKNEIPSNLVTSITQLYILKGTGSAETGSMVNGIYGILDEYAMYSTGLKSGVEMAACLEKNFNSAWKDLALEASSSVEGLPQFRYFVLKYVMYAKKSKKDIYDKIIANKGLREVYTILKAFHEKTLAEYTAMCKAHNIDTEKDNGFATNKKFNAELEKAEYKAIENEFMVQSIDLDNNPNVFDIKFHENADVDEAGHPGAFLDEEADFLKTSLENE